MIESPIEQYLQTIYDRFKNNKDGNVADYIPELATGDPDRFGLVLATADGQVYTYGDTSDTFTIQSMSKPFTYGLALADNGLKYVDSKIDVEASGDAFNEISLDADSHRPKNAMINAGAITSTSLVCARSAEERYDRIRKFFSEFSGRELSPDYAVFQSELETGDRNRAIAWMLKNFGIIEENPEEVVKAYFEQCSTLVNAEDIAMMAATLANNGTNPKTGKQVLDPELVERVLSVMMTAGMYDGAGDWMTSVGLPAKSGVGGGIIGVLPGQLAIAVFSPRLDAHGNSARGVAAFETMSGDLNLHIMHVARGASSAIKGTYDLTDRPSILRRTQEEQEILNEYGNRVKIIEAQGDLLFAGAEKVMRASLENSQHTDIFIYDNTNVDSVSEGNSASIIRTMMKKVGKGAVSEGKHVVIVDPHERYDKENAPKETFYFNNIEQALEWAEDKIIEEHSDGEIGATQTQVPIEEFDFFRNFPEKQKKEFIKLLTPQSYSRGDVIQRSGDDFDGLYFITQGVVNATKADPDHPKKPVRFAVLLPGMSFGEIAMAATNMTQEIDINAQSNTEVLHLSADILNSLAEKNPGLASSTWEAIAKAGYRLLDRTMRQAASLVNN